MIPFLSSLHCLKSSILNCRTCSVCLLCVGFLPAYTYAKVNRNAQAAGGTKKRASMTSSSLQTSFLVKKPFLAK